MNTLLLLASEGNKAKTLWDPTILGLLVFVSALGLFCGSVYLLLATDLGARLRSSWSRRRASRVSWSCSPLSGSRRRRH
ncbi:MAG: hypothetical protein M5T61_07625 [Acidimicrobiia bacterium]|nr:hypothetical protein [Acidimicrobiia bacterium]